MCFELVLSVIKPQHVGITKRKIEGYREWGKTTIIQVSHTFAVDSVATGCQVMMIGCVRKIDRAMSGECEVASRINNQTLFQYSEYMRSTLGYGKWIQSVGNAEIIIIRENLVWLSLVALLNGHGMIGVMVVSLGISGVGIRWVQNGLSFIGKSWMLKLHHGRSALKASL